MGLGRAHRGSSKTSVVYSSFRYGYPSNYAQRTRQCCRARLLDADSKRNHVLDAGYFLTRIYESCDLQRASVA